jgi:putative membrane protein
MNNLTLIIKGAFIGLANIIPGVSGGTIAITMGLYEKLINTISHFFKNFKENMKFLIPIGIGAVLAILLASKLIGFSLDNYPFPTTIFFVGLIVGGLPMLYRKTGTNNKNFSNLITLIIAFSLVLLITVLGNDNNVVSFDNLTVFGYFKLFIVGLIAAATMIIPGISGSFILILLGYYKPIITTVSNLTNFDNLTNNIIILVPFGIGIIIGVVVISKMIEFLLKKYEIKTYFAIIGIVLASIIMIIKPLFELNVDIIQIIIGLILGLTGYFTAYKLGDE